MYVSTNNLRKHIGCDFMIEGRTYFLASIEFIDGGARLRFKASMHRGQAIARLVDGTKLTAKQWRMIGCGGK